MRPLIHAGCLAAGLLSACAETPTQPTSADPVFGKGGGGPANASASFRLPLPTASLSVRGDALFPDAGASVYKHGKCGVTATIFAPNPHTDAVLQTDNRQAGDRKCAGVGASAVPREITIDYGDGVESNPVTLNVHDLGTVVGTELRFLGIGPRGTSRCSKLQFGGPEGGDMVWVTKVSATSWHVFSQAGAATTASCVTATGNVTYSGMLVDFTITTP
jgi:hypothetical protein